eukprot:11173445-Lingulodinium_polyedra.AAC.1
MSPVSEPVSHVAADQLGLRLGRLLRKEIAWKSTTYSCYLPLLLPPHSITTTPTPTPPTPTVAASTTTPT